MVPEDLLPAGPEDLALAEVPVVLAVLEVLPEVPQARFPLAIRPVPSDLLGPMILLTPTILQPPLRPAPELL